MFPKAVIEGLRVGSFRNIVVLTGAGCSVSSGIPDFRSPGGFYDSLRPDLITASPADRTAMAEEPSMVVDIDLFRRNQFPYLEVRRPFILGTIEQKWKPTLTHFFFKILEDRSMLRRIYTQNIDGLDYHTCISPERIVSVHGSINSMSCEACKAPYPQQEFRTELIDKIKNIYDSEDAEAPAASRNILCKACNLPMVKPDTVLFGTSLPERFFRTAHSDLPDNADLLLVVGTSLVVSPANQLVRQVSSSTPRVVINRDPVGQAEGLDYDGAYGGVQRDFLVASSADEAFLALVIELGWLDSLMAYKHLMAPSSQELLDNAVTTDKEFA